jgi:hypothetical protein
MASNQARFLILGSPWSITGTTNVVPVAELAWGGDGAFSKTTPTIADEDAGTIVQLYLAETFYDETDDAVYACATADTWNDTGISHVNFYYGSATPSAVTTITQRAMDDGTLVQGYWLKLPATAMASGNIEDRTLYAEAVSNDAVNFADRVVERTIRIAKASAIHTVNLTPTDTLTTLHTKVARYNRDNSTTYEVIKFVLTPGVYYLENLGSFPVTDGGGTDPEDILSYRKITSSTGNKEDVQILLCDVAPGPTQASFYPFTGSLVFRNQNPWCFEAVTVDMFNTQVIQVNATGPYSEQAPLVFRDMSLVDTSMSLSKFPTGRQSPGITYEEKDSGAVTVNPYSQTLFRANDIYLYLNVSIENSWINTIVAGGFTSVLNCDGSVWWDTFYQGASANTLGINNFRMITNYGDNTPGTDIDTERYVSNDFGVRSSTGTAGLDINEVYYYDYPDSAGESSIAKDTRTIVGIAYIGLATDDVTQNFYATAAELDATSDRLLEFRLYLDEPSTLHPFRVRKSVNGYHSYAGSSRFYDFDFFNWKSGNSLTIANRTLIEKEVETSSLAVSYIPDRTWGKNPYPNDPPASRVIDGNNKGVSSYSPSGPIGLQLGEGLHALDPISIPYIRFENINRYDNPDTVAAFSAVGLDYSGTDTMDAFLLANGGSPVTDTPANGLMDSWSSVIAGWNFTVGDSFCPLVWAHQDGFQTGANSNTVENAHFVDYTSVMQQQWLYQATGAVKDHVYSNCLFLDPLGAASKYLFTMERPQATRIGFKGITSANNFQKITKGQEANAANIHLWFEASCITQFNGNSSSSSDPGVFDLSFTDSFYGDIGSYPTTLVGAGNDATLTDSFEVPGYVSNSGNGAWGFNKYGVLETGSILSNEIVAQTTSINLGSVLPFDIKGNARTTSSLPAAIDQQAAPGDLSTTTLLSFNRYQSGPVANNNTPMADGDIASVAYGGKLIDNDGAARSYVWFRDGIVIAGQVASSYTIVTADVGAVISVNVTADSVLGTIAFGIINA